MGIDRQEIFEAAGPLMKIADAFDPALDKLLKGKSCFHMRRVEEELLAHVSDAPERGFVLYRERCWLAA